MNYTESDLAYIDNSFKSLKTEFHYTDPVAWNEANRYLPKELTVKPGFISYDLFPYWKEVLFELSPLSPTVEVGVMKGRQVAGTTMLIEGDLAYSIANNLGPFGYATSTGDMLGKNFEIKIEKMIDNCNLRHLIGEQSGKKSSRTSSDKKIEKTFLDGSFLHGLSLQSASQAKSFTYRKVYIDEIDEANADIKGQGSSVDLLTRTVLDTYGENGGKILYISTPSILQTSHIYKIYKAGDQRNYFVTCPRCKELIVLKWHIKPKYSKTGDTAGIMFSCTESGNLDTSAGVYYKCQECGGLITNDHKTKMFLDAEWRPTTESTRERLKTYHISKLYAPASIYSWSSCVNEFLQGFDYQLGKVKSIEKYKVFRNNVQGLPFKKNVSGMKIEYVTSHQRAGFKKNTIPNKIAIVETGSPILLLLMSVDVHKKHLRVDITGYTKGGQSWLVDWRVITPDDNDQFTFDNKNCSGWSKLKTIIMDETWRSDDNKEYYPRFTAIDAGKYTDVVYEFTGQFENDVIPIMGVDTLKSGLNFQLMSQSVIDRIGQLAYVIAVNNFKQRIQSRYNSERTIVNGVQSPGTMNFNEDLTKEYFDQFTAEHEEEIKNRLTNQVEGFKFVADGENHAFDNAVYQAGLLEIVAHNVCEAAELESISWSYFWDYCLQGNFYEVVN